TNLFQIVRHGPCTNEITVNYCTQSGVAKKNLHFLPKSESIKLKPNERTRNIEVVLVDGAEWRPNHTFYVNLKIQVAKENVGWTRLYVTRRGKKHRGDSVVHYETSDVTAQAGHDYVKTSSTLRFVGQEYEKYIDIEIIDDKQDEKDETFNVELTSLEDSEATLGGKRRALVTIVSDDNALMNIVNVHKLMGHYMDKLSPYSASWMDQIRSAVSVDAGDIEHATLGDCIKHGLAFPWKFIFCFVPPPSMLGGWLCFFVALALIGLLTAIVVSADPKIFVPGDFASIFGCMVGMKDAITAITLVALGTSLPDTFASKIAAENVGSAPYLAIEKVTLIQDDSADNAVGN
ncbi:unnamed protein product, partial [Cylicostephanus goldi]